MADLAYPSAVTGLAGHVAGRGTLPFSGLAQVGLVSSRGRDWRLLADTTGTLQDRVMVKTSPTAPEVPFANGRIWLLRLADGYRAWEGWSDAAGWYRASGLEVGVEYIPVGIDPYRNHKAVAAGPVVAVKETP